ncbi:uncharacterized protein PADG_03806 [Paracoccidioides brasiliensis Pb18]|uniref:Major facilitator superfamily (MFS) profile domain-containing protein n=1 Tax=Paracoccidioides brasiliensis (strain Pb18) TaxID=502780 RepID=C1G970_PARBD|nr:uncharacterized protein PADG_03806 [Paracoccidioides brasiliensis Pb18]EEH47722.2 hypothetical protein PADG_03806 [Paracoccidioides brasiliensis Pb18]
MQEPSEGPSNRAKEYDKETKEYEENLDKDKGPPRDQHETYFEPIRRAKSRVEDRSLRLETQTSLSSIQRSFSEASTGGSRSMSRVYSLSDGYSHPAVQNGRLQEPEEEDKEDELPTDPESEYIVNWDGYDDPGNPRNRSLGRKWLIVLVVSFGSICVTCTSSIYAMTYTQVMNEFHSSRIVTTLGLSFFILGLGLGPLVLAPLSELYGRRIIYITSFSFFLIWLIPCAVAQNIQTLLIARLFSGISGSAFLSVAGATIGDMFARHELGAPMLIYTASPLFGPELGLLLGGFISQYTTWRWTFYMILIWSGSILICIIVIVPETYHPVLLRRKAIKLRRETGDERWKATIEITKRSVFQTILRSVYRPMLLLTLEPMCLNLCILSAILLGILYLFFGSFQLVFMTIHGFTVSQVGLSFLGIFIGMMLAILSDPLWRRNYARLVRKRENMICELGEFEPEWRLPPAIAGAPLVSIGILIFAWTIFQHVHWIVPIIGSAGFGLGTVLVYSGIFTFLVDAYPLYAASALAANCFLRCSFGAVFPLFGIQLYNRLGFNWASTLLAFLTIAMAPFP